MHPEIQGFFDPATSTVSYVVHAAGAEECAIIDPVLDYNAAAGRISTASADAIAAFVQAEGLKVQWLLETHAHADHIGGIKSFAKSVHKDEVALKMIIANDVPDYLTTIIDNPGRYQYYKDLSKTFKDCVYVKANAGQQFFFPGVTVDMLYTPADVYPEFLYEFNAGFCIGFRLTVNESETRDEKTFVFLGDITKPGAEIFAKMYREDLKCDVVQIGHHGHNGGSQEFYQYCDAKTVFLPNTKELYDGGGYKRYPHVVWAMENADKVIMAWEGNYTIWFGADAAANS